MSERQITELAVELRDVFNASIPHSSTMPRISDMWAVLAKHVIARERAAAEKALADSVVGEIAAERRRQIEQEGFFTKHDDQYETGELALAAGCYAISGALVGEQDRVFKRYWPWMREWWKPKDARRDLLRAAALIIAEIERIDRRALIRPTHGDGDG